MKNQALKTMFSSAVIAGALMVGMTTQANAGGKSCGLSKPVVQSITYSHDYSDDHRNYRGDRRYHHNARHGWHGPRYRQHARQHRHDRYCGHRGHYDPEPGLHGRFVIIF